MRKPYSKKAQVWSLDLVVAGIIFLFTIVIIYVYSINYSSQPNDELNQLFHEGETASQLILSDADFGILSGSKVNQTKLDLFASDYELRKNQIGVIDNFYFIMPDLEINGSPAEAVGLLNSSEINNIVQVTRLTLYKNKPVKFDIFVWN
jgi:hypothetical protein